MSKTRFAWRIGSGMWATLLSTLTLAATLAKPINWGTPDQSWGTRRPVTAADKALIAAYRSGKKPLTYSFDFKDTAKLSTDWQPVSDDKAGLLSCRRPGNVAADNEGLKLRTLAGQECKGAKFSTGYIVSHFNQKYGFFEASMKIADIPGMNNAFWLTTPDSFEIDAAEVRYPNYVHLNLCNWLPSVKSHTVGIGANFKEDLSKSYHDYGILWTPTEIIFEVDGEPISAIQTAGAISGPADVRFSSGLADWAGGGQAADPVGHDLSVRWVHVYGL